MFARPPRIAEPPMARPIAQHDYWFVTRELTTSAFKLRDQGTILGFLWTLLQPLAMLSVLYWLFRNRLTDIEYPGLYLLIGIVLWTFFAAATGKGLLSLVTRQDLITTATFPRELIVTSAVMTVMFSSTLEFVVVMGFAVAGGVGISWAWLALPVVLLVEAILVLGCALLFAPWYVYARDLDNIWNIVLRLGFFLTPIFYDPKQLPLSPTELALYMLNPVTQIMVAARQILLHHEFPWTGDFVAAAAISVVILVAGLVNFRILSPTIAEHI
jgi:lipopolysaccharide transport system permease protein